MPEIADKLLEDPSIDASRAGEMVLERMLQANAAPAAGDEQKTNGGSGAAAKMDADEKALRQEYQANAERFCLSMTEDQYVASHKRSEEGGFLPVPPAVAETVNQLNRGVAAMPFLNPV